MKHKIIEVDNISEIVNKYNLVKYGHSKKTYFDLYQNSCSKNGIDIYYNLDNQMSVDLDNGKTYFLTIQKYDNNNFKFDKYLGVYTPKHNIQVFEIRVK